MTEPFTVVGAIAATTQLAQQLGNCFLIVKEIKRARKDLKNAPQKTEDLFKLVDSVKSVLKELASFTPKENEPNELVVHLRKGSDSEFLTPALKELKIMLRSVCLKVKEFQAEDKNREGKRKGVEVTKNFFQQGATKQKKEVEKLYDDLRICLEKLTLRLNTANHTKTSDIHDLVRQMHRFITTNGQLPQLNAVAKDIVLIAEKQDKDEEHLNLVTAEFKIDNDMVKSLIDTADDDLDDDSYSVDIEWKAACENALWRHVEGESAGDAGVAGEDRRQRASVVTDWPVYDRASHGASVRFTMSVPDRRFFSFLTYAHKAGAELKLFFPKRNNVKNTIERGDSKRLFPDHSKRYPRDPANWALQKESGSSKSSTESVFLIFSKETLVTAEAQSKKEDLEISDVAGELEKHLGKKLNDDGHGYDDIIVKHFQFDIRAME